MHWQHGQTVPFRVYASAGGEAGVNASFSLAFLSEAGPPYVNRCVVAWKIKPFNVTAQDLWDQIWPLIEQGRTIAQALDEAWPNVAVKPSSDWQDSVNIVGDSLTRLKFVYDGTNLIHTDWKRN